MYKSILIRTLAITLSLIIIQPMHAQEEDGPIDKLLQKKPPRPKKPPLPPSSLPLEFIQGERIAFVGNSLAERMNLYGYFETMLHQQFPEKHLVVRNFGRPADEVMNRQRSADYTKLDDPLYAFDPDTFFCFFGWNESFAGVDKVQEFEANYDKFIDEYTLKYPRDDAKSKPRFVLISPIAFEPTGNEYLPDGHIENERLAAYTKAIAEVAKKNNLVFVDLFTPSLAAFTDERGMQYTINGCHANEAGYKLIGQTLMNALVGDAPPMTIDEELRAAINDKSWIHAQDYRMVNGWYVYGGRRTFDKETFPREYVKIRNMAAVRDQRIWDIAQGKEVAAQPDDSETGNLFVPETRFGVKRQDYSEAEELRYLTPDEFIKTCTIPPNTKLELFADETMFPELANPVQLGFDTKGRLWVSCMPTYPQWLPGNVKPKDRLIILEDTDKDGKADKCTTFYEGLHCPTGFEFHDGGVLVTSQPHMMFLKDTDGDDKADIVEQVLDGWATDDTHHTCGAFEMSNGGLLYCLEGISTSTTLETPWGPHRSYSSGGCYVIDPRSWKIRQFTLPGQYNSWCNVFDEWNQGFIGDGTTANHHWETALSGKMYRGRKGLNVIFDQERMRPALGNEWVVSRALPDAMQKQFSYACVINMNGMPRFNIQDDGAGFTGQRVKKAGQPFDLISSTDKHFRPADPHIGPDGAYWFGDWSNALIGHMQYSQRDPNRDHQRGRIYRLVGTDKPLLQPATQADKSNAELFNQLRDYEWRTRYRVRQAFRERPKLEVIADASKWAETLTDDQPRLLCEALWIQQSHHGVDPKVLERVLQSKEPNARAAAVRVVSDESDHIADAFSILQKMVTDPDKRVRAEAVRALSFFPTMESMTAILEAAKQPSDYWLDYIMDASLGANAEVWQTAFLTGSMTKENPAGRKILEGVLASEKAGQKALPYLKLLLDADMHPIEERNKAMTALADMKGNPSRGRTVFIQNCTACHRVGGGEGQDYGPNLKGVATKLKTRYKLVESIIEPTAEVDPKYLTTKIFTLDGVSVSGLVISEDKNNVIIFDGTKKHAIPVADIDERTTIKQSSMPEGQAATFSPGEFLDLIEYLATNK